MPKVIVQTKSPHDGTYDLDLTHFSWRERARITELSGTLPPDFLAKWWGQDPRTVLATVTVMLERAGVIVDLDALLDADSAGSITLDYSDLKDDDGVPPTPQPSDADATPGNDEE